MVPPPGGSLTALLIECRPDDPASLRELLEVVHPELRRLARTLMRNERSAHTLQPTGLVHEAFLRLFQGETIAWQSRQHFFCTAVKHMRRVLTDYGRKHMAAKRRLPDEFIPPATVPVSPEMLVDLSRALDELATWAPDAASLVEMKFYAGMSVEEIAAVLEISPRSVVRTWEWARIWLYTRICGVSKPSITPV